MARVDKSGNPITTPKEVATSNGRSAARGRAVRVVSSHTAAIAPASAMRPKATSQGLNSATARRVIGNVRLNETTPTKPSSRPSRSWCCNAVLSRAVGATLGAAEDVAVDAAEIAEDVVAGVVGNAAFIMKRERSFENRWGACWTRRATGAYFRSRRDRRRASSQRHPDRGGGENRAHRLIEPA